MRRFHFVGGLLRSGSTLLCNILNQNPRFYVSSTSPLPAAVGAVSSVWSKSPEVKGLLIRDRDKTLARMHRSMRGLMENWYAHLDDTEVVIDKSRTWNYYAPLIQNVWPESKIVTIVRDLRSIVGSIEKQHCRSAILDEALDLKSKTLFQRTSWLFEPQAPLGSALLGMEDLIRRRPANWVYLRYEDLCRRPDHELRRLYDQLGEPYFQHDLKNIVNVAEDVDELYSLKFPHQGDGALKLPDQEDWKPWVSPDIEAQIMQFTFYSNFFGYTDGP